MTNLSFGKFPIWPLLGVLVFVSVVHGGWWIFGDRIVAGGGFGDGDSYLRLLRVERLIETGDWLDIAIPDANAPFGTTLHWTRIFDMVLLAAAVPMVPFLGFSKALFWSGVVISPLIHILSAGILVWAVFPVLGLGGALFVGALSAAQAGILTFSLVGRADHHTMFILLMALALGFVFRVLMLSARSVWPARWAGVFLAVGIWEGPENLIFMSLCLGVIGFVWLSGEKDGAMKNFNVAQGLLAGLLTFTLIERGFGGVFDVEYDRISIVHVSFSFLLASFWAFVVGVLEPRAGKLMTPHRLAIAVGGLVVLTLVMILLFPKIIDNPLNDADPAIQPIYARISEYKAVADFPHFLIYFGGILFAGPWLLWRLKRIWGGSLRWSWILIGTGLIIYILFGVNWSRWSMYSAVFMTIVLADLLSETDRWISSRYSFPSRIPMKVMAITMIAAGPMLTGALLVDAKKTDADRAAAKTVACPVHELSQFLNQSPWSGRSRIIAASANFGGELIYRTDHQVLATVHHRNVRGILDGFGILNSSDEAKITKLVRKRQVDLLVLCPKSGDDSYFLMGDDPNALYRRLTENRIPLWARAIKLPDELKNKFLLFEIKHPL